MLKKRRVVITGMGAVTPIGIGLKEYWEGLLAGRSGVGPVTRISPTECPAKVVAEVKDFDPLRFFDRKRARLMGLATQFGVAANLLALEDAEWKERPGDGHLGLSIGMSAAPQDAMEEAIISMKEHGYKRCLPYTMGKLIPHTTGSETGLLTGFQDEVMTISTACSSGVVSVNYALNQIRNGYCDAVICCATDTSITEHGIGIICKAGLLSHRDEKVSRPYDAKRDGGVLGEGAGALLLEEYSHAKRRGARIYAEVLGAGVNGTGYNCDPEVSSPKGMAKAMQNAMAAANCGPGSIDYIGGHGVSDQHLDRWETIAYKQALGEDAYRIPISSVKSMVGIAQSGAGILQLIATTMTVDQGVITPTINYEYPDPVCDLDYVPNDSRRNDVKTAMAFCHGLNGSDAAVILGRCSEN